MTDARAAVFEIVERRRKPDAGSLAESIVVPSVVRVNGAEILVPDNEPITVHDLSSKDVVKVTLTVFARRIFIGDEYINDETADAVSSAHKALDEAQRGYAKAMAEGNAAIESARTQLAAAHRQLAEETAEVSE